ncbi:MAG TPA: hypothetical protein VM031_04100 [Phycisphaerae bacterium]|nr:hypothetical protein [Phycisphaerae bacterium]
MIRHAWIAIPLVAAFLAGGCNQPTPGSSMPLGQVDYTSAFASARETMAQYFSVESANPVTGEITSRPKAVEAGNERLLGGSPARQVASMRLQQEGKQVVAYATVALQRQGSAALRQIRPGADDYDSVPNQTPAEVEGATTIEQNESWRTQGYAHDVERKMLADLRRAVSPAEK